MAGEKPEGEEQEESIASTLAETIAESRGEEVEKPAKPEPGARPERPEPGERPPAERPERTPVERAPGQRPRGPDGKFLKDEELEGRPAPRPQPKPDQVRAGSPTKPETSVSRETSGTEQQAPDAPKDRASRVGEMTKTWVQGDKETLASLPEPAQDFLLRRHEMLTQDYTRKLQKIRSFSDEYGPVDQMFEPHREMLKQNGQTPRMVIEGWALAEKAFMSGGEAAVNMLASVANAYGIPLDRVGAKLGVRLMPASGTPQPQPQPGGAPNGVPGDGGFRDPRLDPLLARLAREDQQRAIQAENNRIQAHRSAVETAQSIQHTVDEFRDATDTEGNLLHPDFEAVENEMAALYAADVQAKRKPRDLEQLYTDAVFANTETRERHLAGVRQKEEDRKAREARGRAERARNAASSVTGAPRGAGGQPSKTPAKQGEESISDTIRAAMEEVRGRAD